MGQMNIVFAVLYVAKPFSFFFTVSPKSDLHFGSVNIFAMFAIAMWICSLSYQVRMNKKPLQLKKTNPPFIESVNTIDARYIAVENVTLYLLQ